MQERIIQSRLLLDEPEFDSITFDFDLMRHHLLSLLESSLSSLEDESDTQSRPEMEDSETIGERFRQEVLPCLITPDFLRKTSHAFKACETRLGRIGQREKAEVALVARSLFELAESETLAFHPLILKVGARTLEQMLGQPEFMSDELLAVETVLSDVLNFHIPDRDEEEIEPEDELADEIDAVSPEASDELEVEPPVIAEEPREPEFESISAESVPTISPAELPAKALYKNFNGLETGQAIEAWNGYRIAKDTDGQVEFVHPNLHRYIILTEERLLLRCASDVQLLDAMEEVEGQCGQALFYLARTFDK